MKNKNILIVLLVSIIVILAGFIVYDKLLSDNNEVLNSEYNNDNINNNDRVELDNVTSNYQNYTEYCSFDNTKCVASYEYKLNSNYKSEVDVEDTYAILFQPDLGKRIFILHNGKLYYSIEKCSENGYCNYSKYDFEDYSNNASDLKEYTDISNIKRIKAANFTTGVDFALLLITNDGNVYELEYNDKFYLNKVSELEKYNVDDVVSYDSGLEYGRSYKVILNDGTTLTKTIAVDE